MNLVSAKRCLLAAVFLWGFAADVSRAKTSSSEAVGYRHKGEDFSLKVPGNWEVQEDLKYQNFKIPMIALEPLQSENDAFRENINVVVEKIPGLMGLEGYFQANLKNIRTGLKAFKMLKNGKLKDGESNSKYMIYTHKVAEVEGKLKVIVFMYIKGSKAYVLTCSAPEKNFSRYLETFMAVGRSFKPSAGS